MICVFVENHGNQRLLSLQIIAMLTWKEMPCVGNLQIAHYVNCRNTNIPGYCCQRNVFCDCYRNMAHFPCSVETIKRLRNLHLYCIVSNVPNKVRKYSGPPELLRNEILILAHLQHSKAMETPPKTRSYLNEMMCFVRILIRLYI